MVLGSFRERCESSLIFSPTEPLRWNGLVEIEHAANPTERGFLARPVRLATRVVSFLLGDPTPDDVIHPYVTLVHSRATRDDIVLQAEDLERVWRALSLAADGAGARVCLRGAPGCGKKLILEALLAEQDTPLLCCDLEALSAQPHLLERALRAARREALLQGAALYLDCTRFDTLEDIKRVLQLTVERVFRDFPNLLAFGSNFMVLFYDGVRGGVGDVFVPLPEPDERLVLWERAMPRNAKLAPGTQLDELARQYPLSGGAITGAVRGAVSRARQRNPQRPIVRRAHLVDSARHQLTGRLATLATRITTSLSWDDLVLPKEGMERLNELTAFARHGLFDLSVECRGDLEVDAHHTVEDVGICLGQALEAALGDKSSLRRFGHSYVPMDEALARVVVDLSGRAFLQYRAGFAEPNVGELAVGLVREFMRAVADQGRFNLHIDLLRGADAHHGVEAIFKALGKALDQATQLDVRVDGIPSTKGTL